MSDFDIASQQTLSELKAFIEHPSSCDGIQQLSIPPDANKWFYILKQQLPQFLQDHVITMRLTFDGEHETDRHHDGISTHVHSCPVILAWDLIQFLNRDAFTEDLSSAGGNESRSAPSWMVPANSLYQFLQLCAIPSSEPRPCSDLHRISVEQNGIPMYAPLSLIPVESLYQLLQLYETSEASSVEGGHETFVEQEIENGSECYAVSGSDASTRLQAPDRIDGQPIEATGSTPRGCPVCLKLFRRLERRHVELHLPHSILCSSQGCIWTGRRREDFKEHWRKKHSETDQEDAIKLYDPRKFVNMILKGTPVNEVAQSAFTEVRESLKREGKTANVLGRSDDLKAWIGVSSVPPSLPGPNRTLRWIF